MAFDRIVLLSKYASIDNVGYSIWRHDFKMAVVTSSHAKKCYHVVTVHAASVRRICSSVRQFLIYSTFVLIVFNFLSIIWLRLWPWRNFIVCWMTISYFFFVWMYCCCLGIWFGLWAFLFKDLVSVFFSGRFIEKIYSFQCCKII